MTELEKLQEDLRLFLQTDHEPGDASQKIRETIKTLDDYMNAQKVTEGCECKDCRTHTFYDREMSTMTPALLASKNVQLVWINNDKLFWLTSSGQLFPYDQHDYAIKYELNALMATIDE